MDNRTTVFIADSAEEFCGSLSAALKASDGFHIIGTACDGEQAIRMIQEKKPDILVLDMMMPGKDGIAILRAISGMEKKPVILATSGFMSEYVASNAANLGARYLMLKPCDVSAVVERLEEFRGGENQRIISMRRPDKNSIETLVTGIIHEIGVPAHI